MLYVKLYVHSLVDKILVVIQSLFNNTVASVRMKLDFHHNLCGLILRVKGRIPFQQVVIAATISEYVSGKKDSRQYSRII